MSRIARLLIANRGEIVPRVARTARARGTQTVAITSLSDEGASFAHACDQIYSIGGLTPAESYLDSAKILAAARATGADAVHPGYGFLSENADFADAVVAAGLTWIGPPASAIRAMGDKARARVRAVAAGLPVTPGYDGDAQDLETFNREAEKIGYPVMVKASAGGGGRGMRLVHAASDLDAALASAASEAGKAFGDPRLLLEKAIQSPRHVEVQLFGDSFGDAVHLFERDCSVQRRHQKVIEEAPSPAVDETLRAEMGDAAVRMARDIGYVGAGTVEFLLDEGGRFYFMEMNTRLQVEHPVTELITGLDLVEWQLRVAEGEPLPLRQDQIELKGWAIEARLCAEDPAADYVPRVGKVVAWQPAAAARTDHAIAPGLEVTPFFDSMLAKIIVAAPTRVEACDALARAADDTLLLGVTSNRNLLGRIARDELFRDGTRVSTAFLAERFGYSNDRLVVADDDVWAIAGWLATSASPERWSVTNGWRDWSSSQFRSTPWKLRLVEGNGGVEKLGAARCFPGGAVVQIGDFAIGVTGDIAPQGEAFVAGVGEERYEVIHAWREHELWFRVRPLSGAVGETREFCFASLLVQAPDLGGAGGGDLNVASPMNGMVVAVHCQVGNLVMSGQPLVVVEAMKMEHSLASRHDGRVIAIHVAKGDQVPPRRVLVEIEAVEDGE